MNLVKLILDQLQGGALDKLGTVADADAQTTRTALAAAVPTILSALAGMTGSDRGARKLASTLEGLDSGNPANLAKMLEGDTGPLIQKGTQLLSSLLGDDLLSSVSASIGKFSGLDPTATKKLIASLAPTILGLVGNQWKNEGSSIGALTSLLADQKKNALAAVPSGFSLADIPGLPGAENALRVAGQTARRTAHAAEDATMSALKWVVPLACVLLLALGLWYFFGRGNPARDVAPGRTAQGIVDQGAAAVTALKPTLPDLLAIPDLSTVTKDLTGVFTSTSQTLGSIRDAASAQAALPKLMELNGKIDGIRALFDKLPQAAQTSLGELIGKQFAPLQEQVAKIADMPEVGDQVKAAVDQISAKLAGLNLAQVSQDAGDIFATLTKTLNGLKETASAEAALPKLQEVSGKIDNLKHVQAAMSLGGQAMLAKLVTSARGSIEPLIANALQALGVDAATVKPILDQILDKLTGLASSPAVGETKT